VPIRKAPVLVVEDDRFLRIVGVVLDPSTPKERHDAFADFFAHDERDFAGWCRRVRERAPALFPAEVRMVEDSRQLRSQVVAANALIVESLAVGKAELVAAPALVAVQKFGVGLRNIDLAACEASGVKVLTWRRRANIACAEMTFTLMLMLAKKMHRLINRISPEQLAVLGYPYKPFDRRHTPNSNWARISGLRMLNESTVGIIGMGEIGREIAIRAAAFGMRAFYYQRRRLPEAEERALQITYLPLPELLGKSDWVIPQLPGGDPTRGFINRERFAQMKRGACLVNVSRAEVVDRTALIEALKSQRLGGFALDPPYEAPGKSDDELLKFDNVVLSPHIAAQPRFNALNDLADMIEQLDKEFAGRA
jgi:phosphoglycerate dehydrogenase-like enzyme